MDTSNTQECSAGVHNKDGSLSKMRAHRGNIPTLAQTITCPHPQCSARFTRSTHLTRHMKNHTNERRYKCPTCHSAQFTRSDLLARHRRICEDPNRPLRLRCCILCTESKVKCDRNDPCSRCKSRGRDCLYPIASRKKSPPQLGAEKSSLSDPSATASASEIVPLASLSTVGHSSALVSSHLSAAYDDCFQPLFNDVFSLTSLDDLFPLPEEIPLQCGRVTPRFQETVPRFSFPQAENEHCSLPNKIFGRESKVVDLNHYLYLFFNAFSTQIPIVHCATFNLADKPSYLLKSIEACGALFVRTHHASTYIRESLIAARDSLAHAFTPSIMSNSTEQVHFLIAVVLLQCLGLWHQKPEERAMSSLYHSMVVAMIRRAGLISRNYAWIPSKTGDLETMWREWAFHEMTKRVCLLSYIHDCCLPIFFGMPGSYLPGEVTLHLPCEQALWNAGSAKEWFSILQEPSLLVPLHERLSGPDLASNLASMNDMQFTPTSLSSFSHFILIHAILRDLFTAYSPTMASDSPRAPTQATISAQYALHNWLQSWTMNQARTPKTASFFENVLPFYWLGQVAILVHQDGLPPFSSSANGTGEVWYKVVTRWLRRIQVFVDEGNGESTLFWDELMKIRLQAWQLEFDSVEDQDGLLAFFP
ncbi:fungal-specific transcription factor domain-containing protein [Mycena polygramma]|nr:fungal-specific transcription factor domain-containing protein [Mycena polygramma]